MSVHSKLFETGMVSNWGSGVGGSLRRCIVSIFETVLILFVAAVALAAFARRVGAPYPTFLALGGALLAFFPGAPTLAISPDLILALFVAPILLDAAYDTSWRDLKLDWAPVLGLVVVAVGVTTAAVALVAHALVPGIPWGAAIALGAIVAPPDAVAATAVLRQLKPPRRILVILEGESLLNDASALVIYRLAVGSVAAGGFVASAVAPAFLLGVGGALLAGPAVAWIVLRVIAPIKHAPSAIILQFATTYGVWVAAEHFGLSPVLTVVAYGLTLARYAPARVPARARLASYAVWDAAIFALNVLAFIFIGLQLGPILRGRGAAELAGELLLPGAVLLTVVVVRFAWPIAYHAGSTVARRLRPDQDHPATTLGGALLVSWSGMRGIVSLATALALPEDFPFRDTILLTSFTVVLGTLLLQGLTLGPLMRILRLRNEDTLEREVDLARGEVLTVALRRAGDAPSSHGQALRHEFLVRLQPSSDAGPREAPHTDAHHATRNEALASARAALLGLRDDGKIGDDAFHIVEEDLDWLEMADSDARAG